MSAGLESAADGLPLQQKQALIGVRDLLIRLSRPELSPRVPLEIRREARALLRHYPFTRSARPRG